MNDLPPEIQEVVERIEKILRLAAKNPNENEAAAAQAKAQELMTRYNLDMLAIEQNSGEKSKRTDEKMAGGLYKYQRSLWNAVADLNYCFYWNMYVYDRNKRGRRHIKNWYGEKIGTERLDYGYTFQHRLVGRKVNVVATRVMAEYLQQTIERLTRERLHGDGSQFFTKWAISYREGMADRIVDKIYQRRRELLSEDRQRVQEVERRHREAARKGASTATGISLEVLAKTEREGNIDFMYGDGTSAKWAAERAETARLNREAEQEYAEWAAANPIEAAREEKKRRDEKRKKDAARERKAAKASVRTVGDLSAYYSGFDDAEKVGIDVQAGQTKSAGSLG